MKHAPRDAQASAILKDVQRHASGRLTVFLGAAPGVGKTYAMLSRAHELLAQGINLAVAVVESHGRADTEKLIAGLPMIALKSIQHHSQTLWEMDLDTVLQQHPQLVLVDELAHRNAPSSRHQRRWQDVQELLDAGIDVMTTLNVQHLESLNDVVLQMTGVRVSETVPDRLFERVRDIRLIDLPVNELLERLKHGKVYQSEHAEMALQHFFNVDNLTALRELAVQFMADHVDDDLRQRFAVRGEQLIAVKAKLLVAIDANHQANALVRHASRVAERLNASWTVVSVLSKTQSHRSNQNNINQSDNLNQNSNINQSDHINPIKHPSNSNPSNHNYSGNNNSNAAQQAEYLENAFQLARQLGAQTELLYGQDVVRVLLQAVQDQAITTLLLGQSDRPAWRQRILPSVASQLIVLTPQVDIQVVAQLKAKPNHFKPLALPTLRIGFLDVLIAVAISLAASAVSAIAERLLAVEDLSVIYMLAVLWVATKSTWLRAVLCAIGCFVSYNFFFIEPRYTLQISAHQGVVTVLAFLASAMIASHLAAQLRRQVLSLQQANRYNQIMQTLARELAVAASLDQVLQVGLNTLQRHFDVKAYLRVADQQMQDPDFQLDEKAQRAADWCQQHQQPCGRFTNTLGQISSLFMPILAKQHGVGVVGLQFNAHITQLSFAQKQQQEAIVEYLSQAVERTLLVQELQQAKISTETEKLRSALLSSVSHDLRSPLAAIMGSADTLLHYQAQLPEAEQQSLLSGILAEGQRLDRYIQNLLDMTRLGHNGLSLNREWIAAQTLIQSAVERLQRYLPSVHIACHLPEQAIEIYVHSALVEQAIFNVLENAAKFSPADQAITLSLTQSDDTHIRICIEDQGVGIPAAEREQIFDMFYTMQRGDRGQSGTGLGLTIVKAIVGAHMGEIQASAGSQHRGTMITIRLPIQPVGTANE